MEIKLYNEDNIKENEIDEIVTRVKVFLMNDKDELLIANSAGGCQLPGGHQENGEDLETAVVREVQEETGIVLDKTEIIESFYTIKHFTRNYKQSGLNRCSEMIYFFVRTNKEPDLNNINLTDNEKNNNFAIDKVKLENFDEYINSFINNMQSEINVIIAKEILAAFKVFKTYLKNNR